MSVFILTQSTDPAAGVTILGVFDNIETAEKVEEIVKRGQDVGKIEVREWDLLSGELEQRDLGDGE